VENVVTNSKFIKNMEENKDIVPKCDWPGKLWKFYKQAGL